MNVSYQILFPYQAADCSSWLLFVLFLFFFFGNLSTFHMKVEPEQLNKLQTWDFEDFL